MQLKSSELLNQQIIKHYYKTLGTSVINSPMSPPSLGGCSFDNEFVTCAEMISHLALVKCVMKNKFKNNDILSL